MMELLEGFPQCEGNLADAADSFIRRSSRNPNLTLLQSSQVQSLLAKIRANDKETVVLKIKDHLSADINCVVVDAILEALFKNRVCQVDSNMILIVWVGVANDSWI